MNHNAWLSCKNAERYLQSNKLFLETLPLVWMVKHWIIRYLSQSCRLWGYSWNEMHQKLEANHALSLRGKNVFEPEVLWKEQFLVHWPTPTTKPGRLRDGWSKWQAGLWFMVRNLGQRRPIRNHFSCGFFSGVV